jgi:hypothetical protein
MKKSLKTSIINMINCRNGNCGYNNLYYVYCGLICIIIICVVVITYLISTNKPKNHQTEEGFTPKIKSFYNSNLRKVRKHLETNVFESSLYKRGAVHFLRYFSIY